MESKWPILLLTGINAEPKIEKEFNRWNDQEHIPNLLKFPGFISTRLGINTAQGLKCIAIYELENVEVPYTTA